MQDKIIEKKCSFKTHDIIILVAIADASKMFYNIATTL